MRLIKEGGKTEPAHTCTLRGTIIHQKEKDLASKNLVSYPSGVRKGSWGCSNHTVDLKPLCTCIPTLWPDLWMNMQLAVGIMENTALCGVSPLGCAFDVFNQSLCSGFLVPAQFRPRDTCVLTTILSALDPQCYHLLNPQCSTDFHTTGRILLFDSATNLFPHLWLSPSS